MKKIAVMLLLMLCFLNTYSQNSKIDTLNKRIDKETSDTGKIKLILFKLEVLATINLDSAINLTLKTLEKAKQIKYYFGEVDLRTKLVFNYSFKGNFRAASEQLRYLEKFVTPYNDSVDFAKLYASAGTYYGMKSRYDSSIYFFEKTIRIYEWSGQKLNLGSSYSNVAIGYQQQSNFPKALYYYQKALKIREDEKNETGQAYTYLNIANTYDNIGDYARAESTYLEAIELAKKNQLKNVELYAYTNLATLYIKKEQWQESYDFAIKAADLGGQMGDQGIEAASLSKAVTALTNLNQADKAMILADKAIAIADSSDQPLNLFQAYSSKGYVFKSFKKWNEAIKYYEKGFEALKYADMYTLDDGIAYRELSECYERTGNFSKALETYKIYEMKSDSARNRENIQKTTELTMNYEFDKKEQIAKANQDAKDLITHTRQLVLITGLCLAFVLTILAFIGYRNKQKANALLKQQKMEIETQKNNLTTSIHYARRIQSAVFPSTEILSANLHDNFILFKPLDIVSGDFYWFKKNHNSLYVVAADSTGHGVPGAFMSILGITSLNEIANTGFPVSTNEILTQLRKIIINRLHQSHESSTTRDGMEMALCIFDMENHKLQFSGAFRPMYLIRNNNLVEVSGDKIPIGIYDDTKKSFTKHDIELENDDIVYLFTDGYADQIGGEERKTFKTKRFKNLLLEICGLPMYEQKLALENKIKEWKGELDQVDDMLVIGMKYKQM